MLKYLFKRLVIGALSIVAAIALVMLLIYSLMDRTQVFSKDPQFTRQSNNARDSYMYGKWEE